MFYNFFGFSAFVLLLASNEMLLLLLLFLRDRWAISSLSMMFVFAVSPLIKSMSKVGHCASERTQLEHTTIVLLMCPYINLLWDVLFSFSRSYHFSIVFFLLLLFLFSSLVHFRIIPPRGSRALCFGLFAFSITLGLFHTLLFLSFFLIFFRFVSFRFVLNSTQPFIEVDY